LETDGCLNRGLEMNSRPPLSFFISIRSPCSLIEVEDKMMALGLTIFPGQTVSSESFDLNIPQSLLDGANSRTCTFPSCVIVPCSRVFEIRAITIDEYIVFLSKHSLVSSSNRQLFNFLVARDWRLDNLLCINNQDSQLISVVDWFVTMMDERRRFKGKFYSRTLHSPLELLQFQESTYFFSNTVVVGHSDYNETLGKIEFTEEMYEGWGRDPDQKSVRRLFNCVYEIDVGLSPEMTICFDGNVLLKSGAHFQVQGIEQRQGITVIKLLLTNSKECSLGVTKKVADYIVHESLDLFLDRFRVARGLDEDFAFLKTTLEESL